MLRRMPLARCASAAIALSYAGAATPGIAVGPQYDSTHVYVAPADIDGFVKAFTAAFGGKASAPSTVNVLPVPASTQFRYIWTPHPFGEERTGWLVSDIDLALIAARACGAEVIVAKFKDAIGYDAVIQWVLESQSSWPTGRS